MPNIIVSELLAQIGNRTLGGFSSVPRYGSDLVAYPSTECPNCHSVRDRLMIDCDCSDVWCVDCKKWFEIGVG